MMKKSLTAVKRNGERFEIKDTVIRKVGSGRPRASIIKDNHRLKMTVLKNRKKTFIDHRKHVLSTTFLIKISFPSLFWILSI